MAKWTEIVITVDDAWMLDLARKLDCTPPEALLEGLRELDWMVRKRAEGKLILACDRDGTNPVQFEPPSFRNIPIRTIS